MSKWYRMAGWGTLFRSDPGNGGVLRRVFIAYVGIALLLFALAAAAAIWQTYASVTPKGAMKRMAASVAPEFFIDMLGLESPAMKRPGETTFSGGRIGGYMAQMLLRINPGEPKSLLASELAVLRVKTQTSSKEAGGADTVAGNTPAGGQSTGTGGAAKQPEPQPGPQAQPQPQQTGGAAADPAASKLTTGGRKVVFVYHSHPRESWVTELKTTSVNEAENAQTNITLIGKRLADKLEEQGIGAVHSGTDYPTAIKGYNWNYSYKYSLQTVQEAFAANKDLSFLFDIHRDSAGRDVTTATIGGKDYAKVYFIVGKKNEHWEQNEAFAKRIHDKLEEKLPGLSRGIWDKGSGGHAEYNQSVSPNSMLVEIGGAYNTVEEAYRTADVLAKTIAELYWDAEKVNGSAKLAMTSIR